MKCEIITTQNYILQYPPNRVNYQVEWVDTLGLPM